jgi:tetratricopeptide (TPR) repeat protein
MHARRCAGRSDQGNDPQIAGVIAANFGNLGYSVGLVSEAGGWVEAALEKLGLPDDEKIAAQLWFALGTLTAGARRVEACERAAAFFHACGDTRRLAASYERLGGGYCQIAQYQKADATLERARSLLRQTGYGRSSYYSLALSWQGSALAALGRRDEAREVLIESVSIFESLGDEDRAAYERVNLAELEFAAGDTARALKIVNTAIDVLRTGARAGFRMADSFQVVALQMRPRTRW